MKTSEKVAVSIPAETLRATERLRLRLQLSRSAAVTEALRAWLVSHEVEASDRGYAEAYLRQPDHVDELAATAAAVIASWAPWE